MTAILAQGQQGGSPFGSLILLFALVVGFYFVAVRPGRRRMQAMQAVQTSLEPGREVITTAGLYATVTAVDDTEQTVTLEIAPGVEAKFARGAVLKVVEQPAPVPDPAPADE